jgi:hypothetical protein
MMRPYDHTKDDIGDATGLSFEDVSAFINKILDVVIDDHNAGKYKSVTCEHIERLLEGVEPRIVALAITYIADNYMKLRVGKLAAVEAAEKQAEDRKKETIKKDGSTGIND